MCEDGTECGGVGRDSLLWVERQDVGQEKRNGADLHWSYSRATLLDGETAANQHPLAVKKTVLPAASNYVRAVVLATS